MGMMSLFLMIMALQTHGKKKIENLVEQNKLEVRFSLAISAPAVAGVAHVQLPLQVDDGEGRAAAGDIVDLLLPLDLNILGAA